MITCIVKLGEDIVLTIMKGKQIILHRNLNKVIDIVSYLYKINADRIILFVQGICSMEISDDSYLLSNIKLNNISSYFLMSESDVFRLVDLAKSFNIKEFYVVSYLDYLADKYSSEEKIICVDKYLHGYCVVYIEEGKVKDFRKSNERSIRKLIGQMREEYDCDAVNAKKPVDKFALMSGIDNFSQLNVGMIPYIDYLVYCNNHLGKNLIEKIRIPDVDKWLEDSKPVGLEEANKEVTETSQKKQSPSLRQGKSKRNKERWRFPNRNSRQVRDIIQKVINLGVVTILLFGNYYVFSNVRTKVTKYYNQATINKELSEYSSTKNKSVVNDMIDLINEYSWEDLSSIEFNSGELSMIILSDSKSDSDKLVENLKNDPKINECVYLGSINLQDSYKERIRVSIKN